MNDEYPINPEWQGPYDNLPDCYYHECVACDDPNRCAECGWNPFVSLLRIKRAYGMDACDYLTKPGQ